MGIQLPAWLLWLRLGLSGGLILFPIGLWDLNPPCSPVETRNIHLSLLGCVLVVYGLGILASAVFTYRTGTTLLVNIFDVLTRYLLAVPAAFLAALALRTEALSALSGRPKASDGLPYLGSNRICVYMV